MDDIFLRWCKTPSNWGDVLSKDLTEIISGRNVKWVNTHDGKNIDKYITIGSILGWADEYTTVWGSGFISQGSKLQKKPRKICAVRGPLTVNSLVAQGLKIEKNLPMGDPALLYPRYYNPIIKKKYKLGIIPHYVDQSHPFVKNLPVDVLYINILDPINKVVDQILSCEMIASSSLHGLIASDAYNVPSTWLEFSDKVIGNGFKFKDYYMSINRPIEAALRVNSKTNIAQILDRYSNYRVDIDLDALYESCPFKKDKQ